MDLNRNGAFDAGEPFRETDADGRYAFENLPPGDYAVADAAAASWTPTYPVFAGAENQLIAAAARRDFVYEPQRGILYIRKMEKGTFYFSAGK